MKSPGWCCSINTLGGEVKRTVVRSVVLLAGFYHVLEATLDTDGPCVGAQ
jgi:hypothetical protein